MRVIVPSTWWLGISAVFVSLTTLSAQGPRTRDDSATQAARMKDFIQPRAYPSGTIPWMAYGRALDAVRALRGPRLDVTGAPTASWQAIGPVGLDNDGAIYSGRVNGVAISPTDPTVIYLSAAGGGASMADEEDFPVQLPRPGVRGPAE